MGYRHESKLVNLVSFMLVSTVLLVSVEQFLPAEACESVSQTISELVPCFSAVSSNTTTEVAPSKSCCDAVNSQGIDCLCSVYTEVKSSIPSSISVSKIKRIPKACNMTIPAGYTCEGEAVLS
ncbi:protein MpLTP-like63 [Marchantia polymorpha subsp. ruderalis]|uniref:Bifunctional inhibitor/plant lipid transfer protein/seed storage helical domain-containing protein n=2 Tax=Marchantia polymorpha TaxID=3197 RepID=A0AAF6ALJ3_MARPO|nr:hypothetical protein MARPO_0005s0135 [Marchantia polymorpha]BBM97313.1 hypothetical protein Mp_1g04730 [Marchantia polymorpha subsp. ruderalis]|eukprot:PTQ48493.1 hypothetical protein MARPO_0005s0135 [Marchantia polymorpha]